MPKQTFIKVQLAPERYDRCKDCPLCGLVPKEERMENYKYVCLATMRGMTSEYIEQSDQENKPCGERWEAFMKLPDRIYHLHQDLHQRFRLPFELN